MDIVSVVGGFIGLAVMPAVVAVINTHKRKAPEAEQKAEPHATFGINMAVEGAVERGDRIANDYLLDLRAQRDEAKALAKEARELALANEAKAQAALAISEQFEADLDSVERRLIRANDLLRSSGLPTF